MNLSRLDKMKHKARLLVDKQEWPDAKIQLEKQCKKFPKDFESWYFLGAVYGQLNDIQAAERCCKKALLIQPKHPGALFNWGMALSKLGKFDDAALAFENVLSIMPENSSALYSLGNVYKDQAKYTDAIECLKKAFEYDPSKAEALFSLGTIYVEQGNTDEAIVCLKKSIEVDPAIKSRAEYFLSPLIQSTIESEHVKELHDKHSAYFDEHLTKGLGYKIPKELYEVYVSHTGNDSQLLDILDLGCGTGLCGIEFEKLSGNLIGVDISPGMIEKARLIDKYDGLITDEINHYLVDLNAQFDLILSADVFIYMGGLEKVIPECARLLKENGIMVFSVESTEGEGYRLRVSGRYAHSEKYIKALADKANMSIKISKPVVIRKEHGIDINGMIFLLQKL